MTLFLQTFRKYKYFFWPSMNCAMYNKIFYFFLNWGFIGYKSNTMFNRFITFGQFKKIKERESEREKTYSLQL